MERPTKHCVVCGADFAKHPKYSRAQWARAEFCSNSCRGRSLAIERRVCACGCGGRVSKTGSRWKQGHNPRDDRVVVFQRHVGNSGKVRWFVPTRDGPRVYWARIVMWNEIGRELSPEEVVDHINGDSEDDRPENLRLFASHADHMRHEYARGRLTAMR